MNKLVVLESNKKYYLFATKDGILGSTGYCGGLGKMLLRSFVMGGIIV
jgi:hypothetical protein